MVDKVKKRLDILKIDYDLISHDVVHTAEETMEAMKDYDYPIIKNLFLANKKGDMFYLVSLPWDKEVQIQDIAHSQDLTRLTFGNDAQLMEVLGIKSGSVGGFNLLNVKTDAFIYYIDEDILKEEYVSFHPNQNDYTLALKSDDFLKYLKTTKKEYKVIKI